MKRKIIDVNNENLMTIMCRKDITKMKIKRKKNMLHIYYL